MAVYTPVTLDDVREFLRQYDVGQPVSVQGIAEGVENSNFRVVTMAGPDAQPSRRNFILTIYEKRVDPVDLPWFLGLMRHVARKGFRCAEPVAARDGALHGALLGKPAALITLVPGMSATAPLPAEAAAAGRALAEFHLAAADYPLKRANALGPAAWTEMAARLRGKAHAIDPAWVGLLDAALARLGEWPRDLPGGAIHADFFPDNVFFLGDSFAGAIDFYFACDDFWAYDLAIAVNAWAMDAAGCLDRDVSASMLSAYHSVRPLSAAERAAFPGLAAGAALRFFLTRLMDWGSSGGALVREKDPGEYAAKLAFHLRIVSDKHTFEGAGNGMAAYGW